MPRIEIEIDRPWLTLALVGGAIFAITQYSSFVSAEDSIQQPVGGDASQMESAAVTVSQSEQGIAKLRAEQSVLSRREGILRGQLELLDEELGKNNDPVTLQALTDVREELTQLLQDRSAAEKKIVEALHEIWDAQGYAYSASRSQLDENAAVQFFWPVEPSLGISAHFDDAAYTARFGMAHHAIDIPTTQGTIVQAVADGIVSKVSDNGMGFNSLVIQHAGGYATLYGHVSEFLVSEGQHVSAGDPVARSGGTPGTKGAGLMTTGAHLHLAFYKDGEAVDPLGVLPAQ